MGDSLKKVQPGDPLAVPAAAWNAFVEAAEAHRRGGHDLGGAAKTAGRQSGIVLVKNSSGGDRGRFEVLGLGAPIFDPSDADALDAFKQRPAFIGELPASATHASRFAVLLEPVPAGEIGHACLDGICAVQIDVTDAGHDYADVKDGSAATLVSGGNGAAQILWKEAGTGTKWAMVRLGLAVWGLLSWGKTFSAAPWAATDKFILLHPCDDRTGANEDLETEITAYVFGIFDSVGDAAQAPDGLEVGDNEVLAYWPISSTEGVLESPPLRLPPGGIGYMPITKNSDEDFDYHWDWLRLHGDE